MKETLRASLQRLLVSASSADPCGLLLWCGLGWLLSPPASASASAAASPLLRAQQQLLYLALADLAASSGAAMARLVSLHRDPATCAAVRHNTSLATCWS